MNLEESELFSSEMEKINRKKTSTIVLIIILAILAIGLFIMAAQVRAAEARRFKVFLNDKEVTTKDLYIHNKETNETIFNIKAMATLQNYSYKKGEYNKFNEDDNSCYLTRGYEVVALTAGKSTFYKTINNSISEDFVLQVEGLTDKDANLVHIANDGSVETYSLEDDEEITLNEENGALYTTANVIQEIFNSKVQIKENSISFYTLDYLMGKELKNVTKYGYNSMDSTYENVKALVYGYMVVEENNQYGIYDITNGREIVSPKYIGLRFLPNSQEFIVTANNNGAYTVGIISGEGQSIIKPTEYDEISVLNDKNELYLVKKNSKYGVLNRKGEVVVYVEYDSIGLPNSSSFTLEDIENTNVLFDEFIPVQKGDKYGLYTINGEETLKPVYDQFGYENMDTKQSSLTEISILSIPSELGIKGLVIKYGDYYGIYDMNTKSLALPAVYSKIFAYIENGVTTYYVEYQDNKMDLKELIDSLDVASLDENGNLKEGIIVNDNPGGIDTVSPNEALQSHTTTGTDGQYQENTNTVNPNGGDTTGGDTIPDGVEMPEGL